MKQFKYLGIRVRDSGDNVKKADCKERILKQTGFLRKLSKHNPQKALIAFNIWSKSILDYQIFGRQNSDEVYLLKGQLLKKALRLPKSLPKIIAQDLTKIWY